MGNVVNDDDYGQLSMAWPNGKSDGVRAIAPIEISKDWSSVVIDDNRNCSFHRYKYRIAQRPFMSMRGCETRADIAAKHGDDPSWMNPAGFVDKDLMIFLTENIEPGVPANADY